MYDRILQQAREIAHGREPHDLNVISRVKDLPLARFHLCAASRVRNEQRPARILQRHNAFDLHPLVQRPMGRILHE